MLNFTDWLHGQVQLKLEVDDEATWGNRPNRPGGSPTSEPATRTADKLERIITFVVLFVLPPGILFSDFVLVVMCPVIVTTTQSLNRLPATVPAILTTIYESAKTEHM